MSAVVDWNELQPVVEKIAGGVSFKFREHVEFDDVLQTAWLHYFENRADLDKLWSSGTGRTYVKRRISSACTRYALAEMHSRTGVRWEDQYRYTRGQLRALTRVVLEGGRDWSPGSDSAVAVMDVAEGLACLPSEDWAALWEAYGPEVDGPLPSPVRTRAARAVKRLQQLVNPLTDK